MSKEELIEAIIAKYKDALSDPIAVAETMFKTYVTKMAYDKYGRDEYVEATKRSTKTLVWFASQGFPNLIERLQKTDSIELYAENNRKVEEISVGYEEHYLNLYIDRGREQFWVPDFDYRKQPQSVIDAYEAVTVSIDQFWASAIAPIKEGWERQEFVEATTKAAEKAAEAAKEAHKRDLVHKITQAVKEWAAGMAAKQTTWNDYLRFLAAGGSTGDCRDSANFWQNFGVEVAELDVRVTDSDATGTYLSVETLYPLTGASKTEYLRRRNPEVLSAQEAKEILAQWETEQVPRLKEIEAAKAAEAEAAEAKRVDALKAEIKRCESVIGYYSTHFNIIAECVGYNATPSLVTVKADENPDQNLEVLTAWLKLAEKRWKHIQKAAEEAANLNIDTLLVEVEDEDDTPHQNPTTVVGNTMYTVTVPADSVWSCAADEAEDFDEDVYKKAGEIVDECGDTYIVFYRPRTERRGGRRGRR